MIESHPAYEVSNTGLVRRGEKLLGTLNPDGYWRVMLSNNGQIKMFLTHRLVALAFIPNPENKPHIDHINHNKQDNRVENLRWATRVENMGNRVVSKSNKLGLLNIRQNKDGLYVVEITRNKKLVFWKSSRLVDEVIRLRDEFLASLPK